MNDRTSTRVRHRGARVRHRGTRVRHRGIATRSALAVVTAVLVATLAPGLAPGAGPGAAAAAPACAPDCTLAEAAAAAGIRFGFAGPTSGAEADLIVAEGAAFTNHGFSWSTFEPSRDVWDFTGADRGQDFATDNGLHQTGFHFAWEQDLLDDAPGWLFAVTDPDELRDELRERAAAIFERYPELDAIDLINEPIESIGSALHHNHFRAVLGDDYVEELSSIIAAEAPADVDLLVNENLVEYFPAKADALVDLVADLRGAGERVDVVGLQTHLLFGEPDWALMASTMQQLADLGVRLWITELDVPVSSDVPDRETVQADRYRRVVELCLAQPACEAITVWGVSDANTWLDWFLAPGTDPLLFDDDLAPKPAYHAVLDALLVGRPPATPEAVPADRPVSPAAPTAPPGPPAPPAPAIGTTPRLTG